MTRYLIDPADQTITLPERFAAPAPLADESADDEAAQVAQYQADQDHALDELCERFAHWCITRRFYGGPKPPKSLLGQIAKRTRPMRLPPDAACSSMLAAMHLALMAHPADAIARRVFELHYLHRVPKVSSACAALGISRQHWYRLLKDFRRQVCGAAARIQATNEQQAHNMSHRTTGMQANSESA